MNNYNYFYRIIYQHDNKKITTQSREMGFKVFADTPCFKNTNNTHVYLVCWNFTD